MALVGALDARILTKPFTLGELREAVIRALTGGRRADTG